MKTHEGSLDAKGLRFGLVASRFNDLVTERLLEGALRALRRHGAREQDIEVVRVPGSFEIPLFARVLAASGRFDAIVCLGAIVQGETPHHDHIARAVFGSLVRIMEEHGIPVALGILTTRSTEQALERAGGKLGNKGEEAASTAVEMASLARSLKTRRDE